MIRMEFEKYIKIPVYSKKPQDNNMLNWVRLPRFYTMVVKLSKKKEEMTIFIHKSACTQSKIQIRIELCSN